MHLFYLTCEVYLHPELCTNRHSKSCPAVCLYDQKGPIKEWIGQFCTGAGVPNTELGPQQCQGKATTLDVNVNPLRASLAKQALARQL